MAKTNLIKQENIQVRAREVDFVTRFERNWEHLREILGVLRMIKKDPGSTLKSKYAQGTLESGKVGEGEEIPYSKFEVKEKSYAEITVEKYAKAVSIEAIKTYGYDVAVELTDDEFLFELQTDVTGRFYTYLKTGSLTSTESTFQMALAMAKGRVEDKFKQMHRSIPNGIVGFVNGLDVYEYIGAANITVQNQFGFQYVKDFMGFNTIFLLSESEIPRGKVIASPVDFCREIFQCQQGSLNGAGIAGNGLDLFCREHLPVAGAGAFGLVGRGISFRPVNVERFL